MPFQSVNNLAFNPQSSTLHVENVEESDRCRLGNVDWEIACQSSERELLFNSKGLRWDEWNRKNICETVKSGPHRTVYRLQFDSEVYYLKRFKGSDWKTRWRQLFYPSRARQEWNAVARVRDANIPTLETVAIGEEPNFLGMGIRDSFLISREISNAVSVRTYLEQEQAGSFQFRQELAKALGELVGKLHRRGLLHRDLHADNILLHFEPSGHLRLWLIDLHAVSVKQRLTPKDAMENISLLSQFLLRHSTRAEQLRFIHSYWRTLQEAKRTSFATVNRLHTVFSEQAVKNVAQQIGEYCNLKVYQNYKKLDAKWIRGNRKQVILEDQTSCCRGLSSIGAEQLRKIIQHPERLVPSLYASAWAGQSDQKISFDLEFPECNQLHRSLVVCSRHAVGAPESSPTDANNQLTIRAEHQWRVGHAFLRRGINTPRPLMYLNRDFTRYIEEFLAVENPGQWKTLIEQTRLEGKLTPQLLRGLSSQMVLLHTCGFHFLQWQEDTLRVAMNGKRPKLLFCHLHDVEQRELSFAERIKSSIDLFSLLRQQAPVSNDDLEQFLKSYCFQSGDQLSDIEAEFSCKELMTNAA